MVRWSCLLIHLYTSMITLYTDWHITPIFYMSWLYCHQVVVFYFVKHIVFCCVRLSFFSSIISAFSRVYKISLSYKGVLLKIFVWCTSLVWHGNTLECTWNAHCMSCKSWMSCWEVTKIWESHFKTPLCGWILWQLADQDI